MPASTAIYCRPSLLNDTGALGFIGSSYNLTIASGTLTVAQALGIGAPLLGHITAALPIRDSSANIIANLDALQTKVSEPASAPSL